MHTHMQTYVHTQTIVLLSLTIVFLGCVRTSACILEAKRRRRRKRSQRESRQSLLSTWIGSWPSLSCEMSLPLACERSSGGTRRRLGGCCSYRCCCCSSSSSSSSYYYYYYYYYYYFSTTSSTSTSSAGIKFFSQGLQFRLSSAAKPRCRRCFFGPWRTTSQSWRRFSLWPSSCISLHLPEIAKHSCLAKRPDCEFIFSCIYVCILICRVTICCH